MDDKKPVIVIVGTADIHLAQQLHSRIHREEKIKPVILEIDSAAKSEEISKILENKREFLFPHLYGMDTDKLKSSLDAPEIKHSSLLSWKEEQLARIETLRKKLSKRWKKRKG